MADCVDYSTIDPVQPEASCANVVSAAGRSSTHSHYEHGNLFSDKNHGEEVYATCLRTLERVFRCYSVCETL